ncbi:hypothetical protein N7466_008136 [Penicillium verhagenii]|uniref:uncharacterized protein n=1 Tax=Penicillium verhagenii TaxID=1562060 RepID=UPI00254581ED|nr:uncharacterized protein N7466_008136 [Penicillium verhagenii]KAJ5923949.1 hypothetical protein N7466_008136 [Penicillium verhagenii]
MRDHIPPNQDPIPSPSRSRNKQAEVTIIGGMRSSSPAPPGLSSGSSSSSISSVETSSPTGIRLGLGFGDSMFVDGRDDGNGDVLAPVGTAISSSASADRTVHADGGMQNSSHISSSSSSWSTPAPSAASVVSVGTVNHNSAPWTPGEKIYTCLFHMLDCHDSFNDVLQWKAHVSGHFRTFPPPRTARCPLCSDEFIDDGDDESLLLSPLSLSETNDDQKALSQNNQVPISASSQDMLHDHDQAQLSDSAWNRMLDHVAESHYQNGQTLAGSRPDFELMRHLYNRRIISDAQFKAMQLAPAPSSPAYHRSQDGVRASIGSSDEPYYAPYSRRREERMRGATRGVSVV